MASLRQVPGAVEVRGAVAASSVLIRDGTVAQLQEAVSVWEAASEGERMPRRSSAASSARLQQQASTSGAAAAGEEGERTPQRERPERSSAASSADEEEIKPGSIEWLAIHLGCRRAGSDGDDALSSSEEDEGTISPNHRLLKGRGGLSEAALDSIQRHLETFAPSGIVDLSERALTVLTPQILDVGALGVHAQHIFELDLRDNSLVRIHRRLLQGLPSLRQLDLSHNGFSDFPEASLLPSLTALDLSHLQLCHVPSNPAGGQRPIGPPGASAGSGRAHAPRSAAGASRRLWLQSRLRPSQGCEESPPSPPRHNMLAELAASAELFARRLPALRTLRLSGHPAGGKGPQPCLRTAPHLPPWTV